MRHLFYKSGPLTIFFTAMSFLVTIISLLISQVNNAEKETASLSNNAVEVVIRQDVTDGSYQNHDFIAFLRNCPVPLTVLQGNVVSKGAFVYSSSDEFLSQFQKSVIFSRLEEPKAQIIISETLLKDCSPQDGKYFYFFNNINFELAGTYQKGKMPLDSYAPLGYMLEQNPNEVLNINFYLDAGVNTQEVLEALHDDITEISPVSSMASRALRPQNTMTDSFQGDRRIFILILALVVGLVLLNLYRIVYFWMYSRKKELYIRMLTGALPAKLNHGMLFRFSAVVTAAWLIGAAVAWASALSGLISVKVTAAGVLWPTTLLLAFLAVSLGISVSLLAAFLKKYFHQIWGE